MPPVPTHAVALPSFLRPVPAPAAARGAVLEHVPFGILAGGMLFNAALAYVNGNVTGLSPGIVIGAEIVLIGAALLVALAHYRPSMTLSVALIAWLFVFMTLRAVAVDPATSVKYFRDILIAPVFMMLGLCTRTRYLNRYLLAIHSVVFVFGVIEAFNVEAYSALFRVKDYFIATRGLTEENFWNTDSDLFVSATRPDARFLSIADQIMDAHRVSSVFLEPVSLGAYCVIIAAYIFSRWERLSPSCRTYLLATNFFLMVACDGRLALVSFFAILLVSVVWRFLPRVVPLLYLPGALVASFLFVGVTGIAGGSDDFPGRVAWTVDLLHVYDVPEFLGLSDKLIYKAVDSGVSYIITTQSLLGLALFWLYCTFSTAYRNRAQIRYAHALCLYVAFNSLVSYGFLSIKTASLLWMLKGMLESEGEAESGGMRP
ncbi:GumE protein [Methylobacterium sp. 4-46]|uniref:hypothetical protein n=1 Tax=unclassified Methylobacterium TaxID=2615210 RepID=UPI000152E033|nr:MULTISPECIES: hypothetical protein [Methylobacterium]ACA15601.1 GumE protein [Methylobacterium sp. 4-46]WFT81313.1 polysaccharide biosynthesis protein GumE [Methylobacterium nodulans]